MKNPSTPHSDTLYAEQRDEIHPFAFDNDVVDVFPDMIRRSVPGYDAVQTMMGVFAREYARPGSNLYDLGCSLGATSKRMIEALSSIQTREAYHIIAVDNAPAMIERFRARVGSVDGAVTLDIRLADVREVSIERASLVALNYTLQFIPPAERPGLLEKIREGMLPGGALLLSEKVLFEDKDKQERFIRFHHAFKREHGYSDLEISQKRTALENVLVPDSVAAHMQRLEAAGFSSSSVWFQCLNFVSILALA